MAGPRDVEQYPDTEYGGRAAGLIQPDPHVMKAWEVKGLMMREDDPADETSGIELAARFESAG